MSFERHLLLQERMLPNSAEWVPGCQSWIIIHVAEGSGYWLKEKAAGEMNVGDCLVLGFDGTTKLRASLLCPMKLRFFTVQPQYLTGLITATEWHQLEILSRNSRSFCLFFHAKHPMARRFDQLKGRSNGSSLAARCALLEYWAKATEAAWASSGDCSAEGNNLRDRFRRLLTQMSETELSTHSLRELSQQLHCSERHFCRLFREQFGIPLRMHQTEMRLLRARQFLTKSNAKVTYVAARCGYRNLSFFIRMFRKRFGMTPGEYSHQGRKALFSPAQITIGQSGQFEGQGEPVT